MSSSSLNHPHRTRAIAATVRAACAESSSTTHRAGAGRIRDTVDVDAAPGAEESSGAGCPDLRRMGRFTRPRARQSGQSSRASSSMLDLAPRSFPHDLAKASFCKLCDPQAGA